LPIEQPAEFEVIINETREGIRFTIPQSVLLRTDEVIQ